MIAPMEGGPSLSPDALAAIRDELRALYRELDEAVAMTGPVCQLSGRCCRFKDYGHTLFLSAPEALLLVADAPSLLASLTTANRAPGKMFAGAARPEMRGPWAAASSSAIRPSRPMPELSETFLARLKQLARRHDWPWNYAPLHQHLRQARSGPTQDRRGWLRHRARGTVGRDLRPLGEHRRRGRKAR